MKLPYCPVKLAIGGFLHVLLPWLILLCFPTKSLKPMLLMLQELLLDLLVLQTLILVPKISLYIVTYIILRLEILLITKNLCFIWLHKNCYFLFFNLICLNGIWIMIMAINVLSHCTISFKLLEEEMRWIAKNLLHVSWEIQQYCV